MKKRILSLGLVLIMILSMAQFTVSADTTATREYQIIDMESVANGTTYVTVTDAGANKGSVAGIADMRAPQYFGHSTSTPLVVLSKTAMDNAKDANGLIYAADGTPFNFRTELTDNKNTINLGGYSTISGRKASATVPVSGNLASIDVVLLSTGVFEKYAADTSTTSGLKDYADDTAFKATVYYTDGSFKEDANLKSKFRMKTYYGKDPSYAALNTTDLQTYADTEGYANVKSQITAFGKASSTKSKVLIHNYDDALNENKNVWYGSNIPTYSIETDAAKTVEKVVFTGPTTRAMVSILAMTAVKASPEDIFAGSFENLPADAITEANYKTYLSLYNNIESGIVAGYEIPAQYADAYKAFAEEMEYYANKYTIIDMTSVANGTVYAVPVLDPNKTGNDQLVNVLPNFTTDYHAPKYPNIQNSTGKATPAYLLNKTIMDSKKDASGYIYADDGVPFSFRTQMDTDDTINIGGIASGTIQKAEIPVSGNFTSIDVVLASTSMVTTGYGNGATAETVKTNTLKNDLDFKATVYYTDGTVVTDPNFHGMFLGWRDTGAGVKLDLENIDTASGYTQPKSQISAFTTALNQGLRIKSVDNDKDNATPDEANWERYWCTQIPTYSIETIPTKTVKKVVFEHKERCVVSILAMTGVNDPRSIVPEEPEEESAPTISVGSVKGKKGDTVSVDVELSNNPGVLLISFDVKYDEEVMKLTKVDLEGKLMANNSTYPNFINPYRISLGNQLGTADVTGDGVLATLTFTLLDNVAVTDTDVQPRLEFDAACNYKTESLVFGVADGSTRTAWLGYTDYDYDNNKYIAVAMFKAGSTKYGINFDGFDFEAQDNINNIFAIEIENLDAEPTGVTAFAR